MPSFSSRARLIGAAARDQGEGGGRWPICTCRELLRPELRGTKPRMPTPQGRALEQRCGFSRRLDLRVPHQRKGQDREARRLRPRLGKPAASLTRVIGPCTIG